MDRRGPESPGEADPKPPIAHIPTNSKFDFVWDDAPDISHRLFLISDRKPVRGILALPFNSATERSNPLIKSALVESAQQFALRFEHGKLRGARWFLPAGPRLLS
jgi:hypothetical protein